MATYILILQLMTSMQAPAVSSMAFEDLSSCEQTRDFWLQKVGDWYGRIEAECVESAGITSKHS